MGRVTIKSIATDLGISHMTVSRALSGNESVTPETRALILQRAEELGYVRSNAANVLRGQASRTLGLVLPNIENEFYAGLANSVTEMASAANLQVMIGLTHDETAREASVVEQLFAQQVGVLAMVPAPGRGVEAGAGFPPVLQVLRQRQGLGSHQLVIDDAPAIAAAVSRLVAKRHRCIAYIGADSELSTGRLRLDAFRATMAQHGLDDGYARTTLPSRGSGAAALQALLALDNPPTAVVLGGVELSNGAVSFALDSQVAVPAALDIIGYGRPHWYRWIFGGLASIELPVAGLARALVDWCVGAVESPAHLPQVAAPLSAKLIWPEHGLGHTPSIPATSMRAIGPITKRDRRRGPP